MTESSKEVYVEIVEGSEIPVFAPVSAIYLGKTFYKILPKQKRDLDSLRFKPNSYVHCLNVKFERTKDLVSVAYCEISEEAVNYILGFEQK